MWLFSSLPQPVLAWVDGWCTDRHTGWERVGTDLFLLNSSRFNQQIIDLIKWHPLLGQEPARGMRISQAKIKISTHSHTHTVHALHWRHAFLITVCPPCSRSDSTSAPQPPKANTGRGGKTRPRSWARVQNKNTNTSVQREQKQESKSSRTRRSTTYKLRKKFLPRKLHQIYRKIKQARSSFGLKVGQNIFLYDTLKLIFWCQIRIFFSSIKCLKPNLLHKVPLLHLWIWAWWTTGS